MEATGAALAWTITSSGTSRQTVFGCTTPDRMHITMGREMGFPGLPAALADAGWLGTEVVGGKASS
ncbi:uncharacterized protein PG998_005360 [Apiospora kogelbergensis]|uniref:Uncharacterized protein n=1 Tax=Apiospora kogelbergensis TaxID=1337665 RepID=A0AAW0QA44_9PEZI